MAIKQTGETNDHSHSFDDSQSGRTSEEDDHTHPYTAGEARTDSVNNHSHSLPDEERSMEFLDMPAEIKSVGESDSVGTFEGFAAAFNNTDLGNDIILPGAFTKTLKSGHTGKRKIKMLWQHDRLQPIGVWDSFEETDKGLKAKGLLALDVQKGAEAHSLLKMGAMDGLSIGFSIPNKGADFKDGVRVLKAIDLHEISLVTFQMNPKATVQRVKSLEDIPSKRELEDILRDAGLSRMQAKSFLACGYSGLTQRDAVKTLIDDMKQHSEALHGRT